MYQRQPWASSMVYTVVCGHVYYLNLCLASADKPPAKEADEAPDDDDSSHSDARDSASAEAALVDARRHALFIITQSKSVVTLCARAART